MTVDMGISGALATFRHSSLSPHCDGFVAPKAAPGASEACSQAFAARTQAQTRSRTIVSAPNLRLTQLSVSSSLSMSA
jgi:hypothetical protein